MSSYTALSICNLALGEVPYKLMASLDEQSLAAATCAIHYPAARDEMFAWHNWEFLKARVALAGVTNDRPTEWVYAYALPIDCSTPTRILPPENAAAGDYMLVGQRHAPALGAWNGDPRLIPFAIEDGTLYTNQPGAVLAYTLLASGPSRERVVQRGSEHPALRHRHRGDVGFVLRP